MAPRRTVARVCQRPGCSNYQPCPDHAKKAWEGSNRKGSTWQGRKVRARILERDPICTICFKAPSTVCDHVVPVADGAPERYEDTPEHLLRGICSDCDKTLSARQGRSRRVGGDH